MKTKNYTGIMIRCFWANKNASDSLNVNLKKLTNKREAQ